MRTIEEIRDEIIQAKEGMQALNVLTSDSKTAIWRLWAYVTAIAIHIHEKYWEVFIKEVKALIYAAPTGTARWYRDEVLKFQLGDNLEWLDNRYRYANIDDEKKIVSQCAVEEQKDGIVLIKAVKNDNGSLIKLESDELQALNAYVQKIKFAGTRIAVLSLDADVLTINYEIHYDPITTLVTTQENVKNEVDVFLANLPFNGAFNVTKFTDAIQRAEGVKDPIFKSGTFTASAITNDIGREFIPISGHLILSDKVTVLFTWTPKID